MDNLRESALTVKPPPPAARQSLRCRRRCSGALMPSSSILASDAEGVRAGAKEVFAVRRSFRDDASKRKLAFLERLLSRRFAVEEQLV